MDVPKHYFCDISETHNQFLSRSFRNYTFDYARGCKTVYFSAAASQFGATYFTVAHHIDEKKFLEGVCHMFRLVGRLRRRSLELLNG